MTTFDNREQILALGPHALKIDLSPGGQGRAKLSATLLSIPHAKLEDMDLDAITARLQRGGEPKDVRQ